MGTDLQTTGGQVIEFGVDESIIESVETRLTGLKADTAANYELVKAGKAEVRKLRTGVDAARKELLKPHVAAQKLINEKAREVVGRLRAVEDPLDAEIERVEAEKLAAAKAKLEEEQRRREEAERQLREEEETKRKAEQAELEAERQRLKDQAAAAEQRAREAERKANELQAAIDADKRAAKLLEQERNAEERRKREAIANEKLRKRQEADAKRLAEERKPDREKLSDVADKIEAIEMPTLSSDWGRDILESAKLDLVAVAKTIRGMVA